MTKPKVLVVYKESAYRRFLSSKQLVQTLKKGNYWNVILGSHARQIDTLAGVKAALESRGIWAKWVSRDQIRRLNQADQKFDWVVSVGGDGTLLDSSHQVEKIPILGVNSDPQRSVARFSGCDLESFPRVLDSYLGGGQKPVLVPRLEFFINGKRNKWLVLNDLLVTTLSPAGTSRYILRVGARIEEQLSSGLWISSAAGSTAAILSAGGKAMRVTAPQFQYVVREAYQKKFGTRRLLKGIRGRGQSLEVVSRMKEGRIFVDGANLAVPFKLGDRLVVRLSNKPLKVIGLKK